MRGVYAFHSCDAKSGVTMVSQSVAELLAERNPEKNVLFVVLCARKNGQFIGDGAASIDIFKERIVSSVGIKREELEGLKVGENLYYLGGIECEEEAGIYFPDMARSFLRHMSSGFDYVVVDTGSDLNNGLAVGALLSADMNFMVLSQNDACLERYRKMRKLYDSLKFSFDAFVLNKFRLGDIYDVSYVKRYVISAYKDIFTVCDTELSREAESEKKTFTELRDKRFTGCIACLAQEIEAKAESRFERKTVEVKGFGLRKRLGIGERNDKERISS